MSLSSTFVSHRKLRLQPYVLAALPILSVSATHRAWAQDNTPPTITSIGAQTTNEDAPLTNLHFTVGDTKTAPGDLKVTVSSTNETLLPAGSLVLTKDGASRILTITPAANKFGQATVKLLVTDAAGATRDTSFVLTVVSVNDVPTISTIADQNIAVNTPTSAISFQIGDVETAPSALTLTGFSSNESLVPVANITFQGDGANRTVIVTPKAGITGTAKIYLRVADADGGLAYASFNVNVAGAVVPPAISALESRTIPANSTTGAIAFHLSGFGDGSVTVAASSSNLDLVTTDNIVFSGTGTDRTITVTPRPDRSGTATIQITATSGALTAIRSFVLTVVPANQRPTAQSQSFTVASGAVVTGQLSGTDPEGQTLTYSVVKQPTLGTVTLTTAGAFTYTPSSAFGAGGDSFTFRVTDPQSLQSEPATVTILPASTSSLVVTTAADVVSTTDGKLSLREAIIAANASDSSATKVITFSLGHGSGDQNIKLGLLLPAVHTNLVILNDGAAPITISGNGKVALLRVDAGATLSLSHLTLSGGMAGANDTGGAVLNQGQLVLDGCTFIENTAKQGGAVANVGAGASTYAYNTTFAANKSTDAGSALLNQSGQIGLINCTLVGPRGATLPLVANQNSGVFAPWNTILEGSGGPTISNSNGASVTSRGHNLASDGAGGFLTGSGDRINTSALLDTLKANKGERVATYLLKAGSPARNGGDSAVFFAPYNLRLDARGQNRLQSVAVDVGAVEMPNSVPEGSFASKEKGIVGTPLTFTTSWRDADGAADIASAQVYFATSPNAQKTGPVLRLVRSEGGFRLFFIDGGVTGTPVDITDAAAAGVASTGWFTNLSYTLTTAADGTLSAKFTFTPLAALVGERKAYLSVVDQSGAGGLGIGAPFGSLKVTQPKNNTASPLSVEATSVHSS